MDEAPRSDRYAITLLVMQFVITMTVLGGCIYVIVRPDLHLDEALAANIVALTLGVWLGRGVERVDWSHVRRRLTGREE
jgi:hypothetical protein